MSDIKEWIKDNLKAGYSKEKIKQVLVKGGYDPNLVEEVIKESLIKREINFRLMANTTNTPLVINVIVLIMVVVLFGYLYDQLSSLSTKVKAVDEKTSKLINDVDSLEKKTNQLTNKIDNVNNKTNKIINKVNKLLNTTEKVE